MGHLKTSRQKCQVIATSQEQILRFSKRLLCRLVEYIISGMLVKGESHCLEERSRPGLRSELSARWPPKFLSQFKSVMVVEKIKR